MLHAVIHSNIALCSSDAVGVANATLACALGCLKTGVRVRSARRGRIAIASVLHAGEIDRLASDQSSNLPFTPSRGVSENLIREVVESADVHFVGNVMIHTLVRMRPKATAGPVLRELGMGNRQRKARVPEFWDGKVSGRIADVLLKE